MDYKHYDLEDFLTDDFFVKWVREPDCESNRFWRQWLGQNPDKKDLVSEASQIILSIAYEKEYKLDEEGRNEMINNILRKAKQKQIPHQKEKMYYWRSIAASTALILMVGFAWWLNSGNTQEVNKNTSEIAPSEKIKNTQAGQKLSLTLPDGSKIKLNSGAKVSFPNRFNDSIRLVQIYNGEVFFEVVKDISKPFIVRTNNIDTKVLGTTFNIDFQSEQDALDVALVSGKVQIINKDTSYQLNPKERLSIQNEKVAKSNFDVRKVTGWKDGILVIEDKSFQEVISILEKWYGVSITCKTNKQGQYNGMFKKESLENVLEGLGFTTDAQYSIRDKKVILK